MGRFYRWLCVAIACIAPIANADELSSGDTAWILTTTALVLFMTIPGLAPVSYTHLTLPTNREV